MTHSPRAFDEWLETDGLGGFASGTTLGIRTRRYHGLLAVALHPPDQRHLLVSGIEAIAHTPAPAPAPGSGDVPITTQRYAGGTIHPNAANLISGFTADPWPTWTLQLPGGTTLEHTLFMRHGCPLVVLTWRIVSGPRDVRLTVRPLLACRDYHALHHENASFRFDAIDDVDNPSDGSRVAWQPYAALPRITAESSGIYHHEPLWYRQFEYEEELHRGFDGVEDLASPGRFELDLSHGEAHLIFGVDDALDGVSVEQLVAAERVRRRRFTSPIDRAADAYIVQRGQGKTIIAGYPWFTDWGRDSFIAMRGLCLATGRLEDARSILVAWADHVRHGMLPNRFPDGAAPVEYNSVDAALWYVIAVHEFLRAAEQHELLISGEDERKLYAAVDAILHGYTHGTRYGIRMDDDGLLAAGEPGVQLTWMDAKIGDWVVTPRTGKAVEVQALWLNALCLASQWNPKWDRACAQGCASFRRRFWNESAQCLYDVIDVDHRRNAVDATIRPNQIYAVGGLPIMLLGADHAWAVVNKVEQELVTPLGLCTLSPHDRSYTGRYDGGPLQRDAAYHQGTAWPFLLGPFVEAWVRVRGSTADAKHQARDRFLAPLLRHLNEAGLGHVSEIVDGDAPHTPRGCPFQAWSLGELLRLDRLILAQPSGATQHDRELVGVLR